jgi:predicted acylesterase/phospholipase RssA
MKRVLFCRSGGGMPGLDIHCGMWLALAEAGIEATECWGTSAGAIVAGLDASGMRPERAAMMLAGMRDEDVRMEIPLWKVRVVWLDHWLRPEPIRALLERWLPASWAGMTKACGMVAVRTATGAVANVARAELGSPADAALASMSIAGIWPAVQMRDGHEYVDGGARENLPLPSGWQAFDEVWLLIANGGARTYRKESGILTNLMRNIDFMRQDQVDDTLRRVAGGRTVRVLRPEVGPTKGMLRFDHELIERTRAATRELLARGAEWLKPWGDVPF